MASQPTPPPATYPPRLNKAFIRPYILGIGGVGPLDSHESMAPSPNIFPPATVKIGSLQPSLFWKGDRKTSAHNYISSPACPLIILN